MAKFEEREHTEPVELCDGEGLLNEEARGWSRTPLHICNLKGHFPKKKKWNFWLVLNEECAFSATIANVDYLGLGSAYVMDFKNGLLFEDAVIIPRGIGMNMPERVEETVELKQKTMQISFENTPEKIRIRADSPSFRGQKLAVDITLRKPPGHETLNTVIPWSRELFHFTSKQNTLPAEGAVTIGDRTYTFRPESANGVLDFGRGMWPSKFVWNWAVFNHRQGDDIIGINLGGKWTDGTGATENGVCLNGKLFKISEDVTFTYDTADFMKPWTMRTTDTDTLDLKLTPKYQKASSGSSSSQNNQVFGLFSGKIRVGGRTIDLRDAFGWSEQVIGNW